jgi:hypothetical protein
LKSILIPSPVVALGKESFCGCKSLELVTFESGSRLERIGEYAFRASGLTSILIPSSVIVLGKESFSECKSLELVTFESGSQLGHIDPTVFKGSRVSFCSVSQEFTEAKRSRKPEKDPGRICRAQ